MTMRERVGAILDEAVAAGANTVSGVSFIVSDPAGLRDLARAAAMTDAQSRAEQLANLAGVELGPVMQVSEAPGPGVPVREQPRLLGPPRAR